MSYVIENTAALNNGTTAFVCSGSNRLLVIACGVGGAGTGHVDSVTYNGVALTKAIEYISGHGDQESIWYLINPASGSNDVVITLSGAGSVFKAGAVSLSGMLQSSQPFGSANDADGNWSIDLNPTSAGGFSIAVFASQGAGAPAPCAGQTEIALLTRVEVSYKNTASTGASQNMCATGGGIWGYGVMANFSIIPSGPVAGNNTGLQ